MRNEETQAAARSGVGLVKPDRTPLDPSPSPLSPPLNGLFASIPTTSPFAGSGVSHQRDQLETTNPVGFSGLVRFIGERGGGGAQKELTRIR